MLILGVDKKESRWFTVVNYLPDERGINKVAVDARPSMTSGETLMSALTASGSNWGQRRWQGFVSYIVYEVRRLPPGSRNKKWELS